MVDLIRLVIFFTLTTREDFMSTEQFYIIPPMSEKRERGMPININGKDRVLIVLRDRDAIITYELLIKFSGKPSDKKYTIKYKFEDGEDLGELTDGKRVYVPIGCKLIVNILEI